MKMKQLACMLCLLVPVAAYAKPDTVGLLKGQKGFSLSKVEPQTGGATVYRIEICHGDQGCLLVEGPDGKLDALADYAYLYALQQEIRLAYPAGAGTSAQAASALEAKFKADVLATEDPKGSCKQNKDQAACVMHLIRSALGIKRFSVNYDEGANYDPVPDDAD